MTELNVDNIDLDMDGLDGLDDILGDDTNALEEAPKQAQKRELSFFRSIPVDVTLEVASTSLPLGDLMQLGAGAVVELDKTADEPLDVRVNGRLLATAEVVVVNGKYGLRLVNIVDDALDGLTL